MISIDEVEKLMAYCYYAKAESLLRTLLDGARLSGFKCLHYHISEAINEVRRRHILGVLRHCQHIRQIQSKGVHDDKVKHVSR